MQNRLIVLVLSHCLLNPKVRAKGLAQHPEIKEEILKLAKKYNAEIRQLPCPEFLFLGEREPKTYDEYIEIEACPPTRLPNVVGQGFGRQGFKDFCEKLAEDFVNNLKEIDKCHLIIIGIARSPSCSVSYVYDKQNNLKKGQGLLIYFLREKITDNVAFAEMDYRDIDASIRKIEEILKTICS